MVCNATKSTRSLASETQNRPEGTSNSWRSKRKVETCTMKTKLSRTLASLLMLLFALSPVWATCGGGGGGGTGGVGGGGSNSGPAPVVYNVPWKMWEAK